MLNQLKNICFKYKCDIEMSKLMLQCQCKHVLSGHGNARVVTEMT